MLTPELEQLIDYAIQDGEVTAKERSVLLRKAQEFGADPDEVEMILDAKLQQKKASAKPNNKQGEIRKCPACGAMVSAFTTTCNECGFEFNNVEAVKSANVLFEKLQAIEMEKAEELAKHDNKKNEQLRALSEMHNKGALNKLFADKDAQNEERDDLIRTFQNGAKQIERKYLDAKINLIKVYAVPNTKGDLLELLSMASSSAYDNDGVIGLEEEVWLQKTDQIYQKLLICASGDTTTLNQATSMIVSLIKRLPSKYKNFTRIPKDLRDKVNAELKAEADEAREAKKEALKSILTGWRGIGIGVGLLLLIIGFFVNEIVLLLGLISTVLFTVLAVKAYKEINNDPLI